MAGSKANKQFIRKSMMGKSPPRSKAAADEACPQTNTVVKVTTVKGWEDHQRAAAPDSGLPLAEKDKHESSFQSFERVLSTPETVVKCDGDNREGTEMVASSSAGSPPTSEREAVYLFKD